MTVLQRRSPGLQSARPSSNNYHEWVSRVGLYSLSLSLSLTLSLSLSLLFFFSSSSFKSQIAGYQAEFLANGFLFNKTVAAFSKLSIFPFSLFIMLFRDSTFPLMNVRNSFLVEHFESMIRGIVESAVSRCTSAKAGWPEGLKTLHFSSE